MIEAYVDVYYACHLNRRIVSGYTIKLLNNYVLWKSKNEAEYISVSYCVRECLFLSQLLSEMLSALVFTIVVYEDNQSAIKISSTLETKRSKHIDVRHCFPRELVANNKIKLVYIKSDDQVGDMFTKVLCEQKFSKF
ncbi:hypothetical protein PR048_024276 [Dryococelus australis]|uniref:Copia protein n=1 Tax=Dryococelus australis TaxID=614101 RepID=A0ABQ9GN61_9NEOP|nr:hypothetical protein PR048_024276 [Dryococelus australis]